MEKVKGFLLRERTFFYHFGFLDSYDAGHPPVLLYQLAIEKSFLENINNQYVNFLREFWSKYINQEVCRNSKKYNELFDKHITMNLS